MPTRTDVSEMPTPRMPEIRKAAYCCLVSLGVLVAGGGCGKVVHVGGAGIGASAAAPSVAVDLGLYRVTFPPEFEQRGAPEVTMPSPHVVTKVNHFDRAAAAESVEVGFTTFQGQPPSLAGPDGGEVIAIGNRSVTRTRVSGASADVTDAWQDGGDLYTVSVRAADAQAENRLLDRVESQIVKR